VSFNVAMLKQMKAEGLSLDACIRVLEAGEKKADPTAAERMRKMRSKRAIKADVTPVTVTDEPLNDNTLIPVSPSDVSNETITPALKPEHVVEVWNDLAARRRLKPVQRLSPERRKVVNTRIGQHPIEDFTEAIAAVERSPFLCGDNDRGWRATFDWMLKAANFNKLIEGTYDR
jgi:hypothetical protein